MIFSDIENYLTKLFLDAFQENSIIIFILTYFAGILASLTPCVAPMIPVIYANFVKAAHGNMRRGFYFSILFVATVTIVYSILGLTAALTGSMLGQITGTATFNLVSALVIFVFSLSMFGFFEFRFPAITFKASGIVSTIIMGILSSLVFSSCTAPVLATILLFVAQTKSIIYGTSLLVIFSLGMGSIFILIGLFGGALKIRNEKVFWTIKYILGIIMLLTVYYFIKRFFIYL